MKFLDKSGVTYLWNTIKNGFFPQTGGSIKGSVTVQNNLSVSGTSNLQDVNVGKSLTLGTASSTFGIKLTDGASANKVFATDGSFFDMSKLSNVNRTIEYNAMDTLILDNLYADPTKYGWYAVKYTRGSSYSVIGYLLVQSDNMRHGVDQIYITNSAPISGSTVDSDYIVSDLNAHVDGSLNIYFRYYNSNAAQNHLAIQTTEEKVNGKYPDNTEMPQNGWSNWVKIAGTDFVKLLREQDKKISDISSKIPKLETSDNIGRITLDSDNTVTFDINVANAYIVDVIDTTRTNVKNTYLITWGSVADKNAIPLLKSDYELVTFNITSANTNMIASCMITGYETGGNCLILVTRLPSLPVTISPA